MKLEHGWLTGVRQVPSPHCNERPHNEAPSLLVIHNISLPPGEYGGPWIDKLFTGPQTRIPTLLISRICALQPTA